jgi:nucleotide-binding universal stress UspA family protein
MKLRNLLVPVTDNAECERALDVACKLADDHGATVTILHVIEIPPLLPLGAHMADEEDAAHRLLERVSAIADGYGVDLARRTLYDRDASEAIVGFAARRDADLIVLGAPRKRGKPFGSTVEHVLRKADCRVLVIGAAAPAESPTPPRSQPRSSRVAGGSATTTVRRRSPSATARGST